MVLFSRQAIGFVTLVFCSLLLFSKSGYSQHVFVYDSNYYKVYPQKVTGRVYSSKKYTSFFLEGREGTRNLRYYPNTPVTVGVGATYRILSLNIGFGLQFLNPNRDERGKTKYFDLQSHIYAPKWVVDLFGQFYSGYYISPRGYAANTDNEFYIRPDVKVQMLGTSVYRLVNGERLSYRAAFLQNEWQKKSAGSFLFGGEIYAGIMKGDSALVPAKLSSEYAQRGIDKTKFIEFGPGIGYAYTAVIKKHFFVTGSLTVTADLSFVAEYDGNLKNDRTTVSPNASMRAVVGYNSDKWIASISWVNTNTNIKGASSNDQYLMRTGNFRVTLAKRFTPGKRLKKRLRIIEALPLPTNN